MTRKLAMFLLSTAAASPLASQGTRLQAAIALQAAAFPHYVAPDDRYTRPVGATLAIRLRSPARLVGLELALTHIPQAQTDRSAAPTLTVARAGLLIGRPPTEVRRVALHGSVGSSLVIVDAQTIDCGSFPLCSEWSPFDVTSLGLAFGAGLEVLVSSRVALLLDALGHVAALAWDPIGSKQLLEVTVGLALRL